MGLKMPPTLSNDAVMAYWLNGVMPDLAERTWRILREQRMQVMNGTARLKTKPVDHVDVGSYRKSDAWTWVNLLCAAKEMGDEEAVRAADTAIIERFTLDRSASGARKLAGLSSWANGVYALAQFVGPGSLRGLANGAVPDAWRTGPLLSRAAYPAVLVAKAVSDGSGLDLVLRPGAGPVQTTLEISRLRPGCRYRISGADEHQVLADSRGRALVNVSLHDRHEVQMVSD